MDVHVDGMGRLYTSFYAIAAKAFKLNYERFQQSIVQFYEENLNQKYLR